MVELFKRCWLQAIWTQKVAALLLLRGAAAAQGRPQVLNLLRIRRRRRRTSDRGPERRPRITRDRRRRSAPADRATGPARGVATGIRGNGAVGIAAGTGAGTGGGGRGVAVEVPRTAGAAAGEITSPRGPRGTETAVGTGTETGGITVTSHRIEIRPRPRSGKSVTTAPRRPSARRRSLPR